MAREKKAVVLARDFERQVLHQEVARRCKNVHVFKRNLVSIFKRRDFLRRLPFGDRFQCTEELDDAPSAASQGNTITSTKKAKRMQVTPPVRPGILDPN